MTEHALGVGENEACKDMNFDDTPYTWLPFRRRRLKEYLTDALPTNILVYHLLATGFITGILDATTYADYGTFTSNQTGNTVLLGIGSINLAHVNLMDVGISLAAFLVTVLVTGQWANSIRPGKGRTRWWTIVTSLYQTINVLILPSLAYRDVIQIDDHWSWLVILLLASSAGAQVSMAKQFSIPEIPTAMLTSPFADVLTDPYLFSRTFARPYNVPRNRRVSYIALLIAGVFVGAVFHKHGGGTRPVLLFAGILKFVVTLSFFFVPQERPKSLV